MVWGLLLFLLPALIPGALGAIFVLQKPDTAERHTLVVRTALIAAVLMVAGYLAFYYSPWVQANSNYMTRDAAAIDAVQPFVWIVWTLLNVVLWFGIGGWLASSVRKGGAMPVLIGLIVLIVLPFTLFAASLLLGCFFAGACM